MTELTETQMAKLREIVPPKWTYLFSGPPLVFAVFHTFTSLRATDVLINSLRIGAVFFVVIAVLGVVDLWPIKSVRWKDLLLAVIFFLFGAVLYGAVFYILGASMRDFFPLVLNYL